MIIYMIIHMYTYIIYFIVYIYVIIVYNVYEICLQLVRHLSGQVADLAKSGLPLESCVLVETLFCAKPQYNTCQVRLGMRTTASVCVSKIADWKSRRCYTKCLPISSLPTISACPPCQCIAGLASHCHA